LNNFEKPILENFWFLVHHCPRVSRVQPSILLFAFLPFVSVCLIFESLAVSRNGGAPKEKMEKAEKIKKETGVNAVKLFSLWKDRLE